MNKIGILDPDGKNNNPLTDSPYSDEYKRLAMIWKKFPAYSRATEVIQTIGDNQVILITSGTGSGKTVLVPKFVLHSMNYNANIAITLPKQIIAKSAAEFAAQTLDVELGKEVGYQYKGSEKGAKSGKTKLLYATDGTIVARLLTDPMLSEFNAVVIDEAHERKVQIDFLMYLLRETLTLRPEFKLVIMSATVNSEIFASYFSSFKFKELDIGGQTNYPITSIFLDKPITKDEYIEKGMSIIKTLLSDTRNESDAILFFVTSINETFDVCKKIRDYDNSIFCVEMYAGMDSEKQELAQDKTKYIESTGKKRKLVVSTNVAESSLTVDGVKYVIDSGYELLGWFDADKRAKILNKQLISHAQAKQRMGRSGRTGPGVCYHLYTKTDFDTNMKRFPEPNIRTSDITSECMRLLNMPKIGTAQNLLNILSQFIEPPREQYIRCAMTKLIQLGIVVDGEISKMGLLIGKMQVEPDAGLCLYAAYNLNCLREVVSLIAVIEASKGSISDLFNLPTNIAGDDSSQLTYLTKKYKTSKKDLFNDYGDHLSILKIISKYLKYRDDQTKLTEWGREHFIKLSTIQKGLKYYRKILSMCQQTFSKEKKIDVENLMEYKLEYRIMGAILYGYRLNMGYYKETNESYNTDYAKKISIHKESFMHYHQKPKSNVVYNTLFGSQGRFDMNIVSAIPIKSQKLCNILMNAI
jgi:HrpA-like RNA helicase